MIRAAESKAELLGEDVRAGELPTAHQAGAGAWGRAKKSLYKKQRKLEKNGNSARRRSIHPATSQQMVLKSFQEKITS